MKRIAILPLALLLTNSAIAQQEYGHENIDKLCGCFSVNFKYAETFSPDNNYKYHDREETNATELALLLDKTKDKIIIQHLLIVADTMVIKHWREEWAYESPVMYQFMGDRTWKKKELAAAEVKGKWTQTVWEVSDEPRYQGVSAWVNNDNKTFWESTADAPLPRREYTVRSDYNVMKRHNRIYFTADGYVHEQDNDKILRTGGTDKLIAQEKGYNSYYRMADGDCKAARDWWAKNGQFWTSVRGEWEAYLAGAPIVTLKAKVDNKMMHEQLNDLWKEWRSNKIAKADLDSRVKQVISKFYN